MTYLTEKWKKGELESGYYFFKTKYDIKIGFLYEGLKYPYDRRHSTIDDVIEVLAQVPSYEEWKLTGKFAMEAINVAEENQQLKELIYSLKCCLTSENIEPQIRFEKSLAKIEEVLK